MILMNANVEQEKKIEERQRIIERGILKFCYNIIDNKNIISTKCIKIQIFVNIELNNN